jgi:hypothetical protein
MTTTTFVKLSSWDPTESSNYYYRAFLIYDIETRALPLKMRHLHVNIRYRKVITRRHLCRGVAVDPKTKSHTTGNTPLRLLTAGQGGTNHRTTVP